MFIFFASDKAENEVFKIVNNLTDSSKNNIRFSFAHQNQICVQNDLSIYVDSLRSKLF